MNLFLFLVFFVVRMSVRVYVCRCECVCVSVALLFLLSSNHFECVGTPVAASAAGDAPSDVVVVAFVVVITQEIALHLMTAIFISFASFRLGFSQQSKRAKERDTESPQTLLPACSAKFA